MCNAVLMRSGLVRKFLEVSGLPNVRIQVDKKLLDKNPYSIFKKTNIKRDKKCNPSAKPYSRQITVAH